MKKLATIFIVLTLVACSQPARTAQPSPPANFPTVDLASPQATPTVKLVEATAGTAGTPTIEPPTAAAPQASPTALPTDTAAPGLSSQVSLTSRVIDESGNGPNYTLHAVVPVLQGSDDPRVTTFNNQAAAEIQRSIDTFHQGLNELPAAPFSNGSAFDLKYTLVSPPGGFLSLQFTVYGMTDGAAHPYHNSSSFNFDIEQGRQVSLDELFLPGSNYLQTIADYCKADLASSNRAFDGFSGGADPTPDNYAVWNLVPDGLLITFNEYQVAPYAAGPQQVTIPVAALRDILNPAGALANWGH